MVAANTVAKPQQENEPTQSQRPGVEAEMRDKPIYIRPDYEGGNRLKGKVALISGGDSGIGRAVAIAYAIEGADVAIIYRAEQEDVDANETRDEVVKRGRKCILIRGDVGDEAFCRDAVERVKNELGRLDILVNNAAEQHPKQRIDELQPAQWERTFRTNAFGPYYLSRAALPLLKHRQGGCIINTTSVVAYRGSEALLDYSSTKGALLAFTRSLAQQLAEEGVRVNGVAPGPIWTPLITSTFPKEKVEKFGKDVALGRPGQPFECAGAYVFLASDEATYITGQVIHVNGGEVVNG
ncbi:MAG: SDR family oxidoreductase [Tepidisphaeraceae bacterium]